MLGSRKRKNAAADQFLNILSEVEDRAVVVKGGSVAEITKDSFLLSYYGDADILIRNSCRIITFIDREDFVEYKIPVLHEEANIRFEGNEYDVHKNFPVWVLDGTPVSADLRTNEPIVRHSSTVNIRQVSYEALLAESTIAEKYMPRRASVPAPHWAVFVQIVHMYRDLIRLFMGWMYKRVLARVRPAANS